MSIFSFGTFCDTRLVAGASDGASVRVHWPLLVSRGSACFAKLPFRVRTSCFNPRRSRRRSCFVGEFEYKWQLKLWYVYSNFLLMLLTDAVIVLWHREKPRAVRVLCSRNGQLCSLEYVTDWYVPMISRRSTWPWYRCQQRVCIKWQHRRRRVRTRWCRKWSNCWWWRCLKRCYCNKTISPRKRTVRG